MFASLLESMGVLRNPSKELPLNGITFSDYKVSLIQRSAALERQLHDGVRNKVSIDKEAIVAEMKKVSALLDPVYDIQNARQQTFFPLS